jgi:carbonic anhydrase
MRRFARTVELIFDQSIGQVFVTRVAGNLITPEIIGSLEYGSVVLGTKVILLMGHSNCGAVKATIRGKGVPGQISSLFPHIQPAVDQAGRDLVAETMRAVPSQSRTQLLRRRSRLFKQRLLVVIAHGELAPPCGGSGKQFAAVGTQVAT